MASLADTDTFAVTEIDINPLIVHADGCTAVDALIISADVDDTHSASRKAS